MFLCVTLVLLSLVIIIIFICTTIHLKQCVPPVAAQKNVYSIAALKQLSRIVVHRGKLHVLKMQMDYLQSPMN